MNHYPNQFPPSPRDWAEKLNEDNRPDRLRFQDVPGEGMIPGPNDPWRSPEIIGSRINGLTLEEARTQNGSKTMRKRLTTSTLDTTRQLKTAGKVIDLATRMAGEGAIDDEILTIARRIQASFSEADIHNMHQQVARIAAESGRVAFPEDDAVDDDGAQKQPDPTKTDDYVKIVRAPTDSSVQMALKGQKDVHQPTASRVAGDDPELGDTEDDEDLYEEDDSDDEFDDMNDEDGLENEDDDDDFSFEGDDDEDDMDMSMNDGTNPMDDSHMPSSEVDFEDDQDQEAPEIVDEEDVMHDGEDLGSDENIVDDSGEINELEDLSMTDEGFNADDFLEDDDEDDFAASMGMGGSDSMFASVEDAQVLASMGIESGAESAGVLSSHKLAMTKDEASPEMFRGRQARRSKVNPSERSEYVVWDTELEPEIAVTKQSRRASKPAKAKRRQASKANTSQRRQSSRSAQDFRPSRVRTSSRRAESGNVFDEMFAVPNVSKFFEH